MLAASPKMLKSMGVRRQVLLVLVLELLDEVVDKAVVEVVAALQGLLRR